MTEKTLSDKRISANNEREEFIYPEGDVKEFIKRLKEEFSNHKENPHKLYAKPYLIYEAMMKIIDKLAGDKLI